MIMFDREFWTDKRVVVVGGAGFIGSHTVDSLVKLNADITIVDDFSTGERSYCNSKAKLFEIDAASDALAGVFFDIKPEVVMTFASVVDIPVAIKNPLLTCKGIKVTVNTLENAVIHNVEKVLYASSGYIYGNTNIMPISEDQPTKPLNPYNIAKATGEHYLSFFNHHYKLPCIALRYAPTYGPRRMIGPIYDYIRSILQGSRSKIFGHKTRDYIYVDDVVSANILSIERSTSNYNVFNIGTGLETELDNIYKMITHLLDSPDNKPIYCPTKSSEIERFVLDITKAKKELGFHPNTPMDVGLQETINWMKQNDE